jgi:hypothetical protein
MHEVQIKYKKDAKFMASIGFSLNNFFFSVNSLPWVHVEAFQRRSLAPVR